MVDHVKVAVNTLKRGLQVNTKFRQIQHAPSGRRINSNITIMAKKNYRRNKTRYTVKPKRGVDGKQ